MSVGPGAPPSVSRRVGVRLWPGVSSASSAVSSSCGDDFCRAPGWTCPGDVSSPATAGVPHGTCCVDVQPPRSPPPPSARSRPAPRGDGAARRSCGHPYQPHHRDVIGLGERTHRPPERGADLLQDRRRRDRAPQMLGHERHHLATDLQVRHLPIQVDPIRHTPHPTEHAHRADRSPSPRRPPPQTARQPTPLPTPDSAVRGEASLVVRDVGVVPDRRHRDLGDDLRVRPDGVGGTPIRVGGCEPSTRRRSGRWLPLGPEPSRAEHGSLLRPARRSWLVQLRRPAPGRGAARRALQRAGALARPRSASSASRRRRPPAGPDRRGP
jgi:hypothetical protein